MRRISTFLFGVMVGGVLVYAALHYHVVRAADGVHLVRKTETTLAGSYVDIRRFGPREWVQHPRIAAAIVEAGQDDLMQSAADHALQNGLDRLLGPGEDR